MAIAALTVLPSLPCSAEVLLRGEVHGDDGTSRSFRMTGKSRADVVGGELVLAQARYVIQRVSVRGLIGAHRHLKVGDLSVGEFAVFSSSFSEQTAQGQPWVPARRYVGCAEPYNSFLAIYRVEGASAVEALGPVPYPQLTEHADRSSDSVVYCLLARPGEANE